MRGKERRERRRKEIEKVKEERERVEQSGHTYHFISIRILM